MSFSVDCVSNVFIYSSQDSVTMNPNTMIICAFFFSSGIVTAVYNSVYYCHYGYKGVESDTAISGGTVLNGKYFFN